MNRRSRLLRFALTALLSSSPIVAQAPAPWPPEADVETAPVEIDGRTLFRLRGISSYPAAQRASDVAGRIVRAARDSAIAPESLTLVEMEFGTEIRAGGQRLMVVSDADAEVEGVAREPLASVTSERIRQALRTYRQERRRDYLIEAAQRTAAALVFAGLALLAIRWLSRRLTRVIEARLHRHVRGVSIGSFEFLRADSLWAFVRGLFRAARALAVIAVLFSLAYYGLRQFPWTRASGMRLDDWVVGPIVEIGQGFARNVPNLIFLVILWFVTRWALRLLRLFFDAVGRAEVELPGFDPEWGAPTYKLLRLGVIVLALVVAYPYIPGSGSEAFKGISIFLGLVFSLGSTSAIANIVAGYTMTYRRAFRKGDRVKIGEVVGTVTDIRLQVTHLRTVKNEEVVIPNSTILNTEVTNYSALAQKEGLILHTSVGIGYETPWRQVEAMLLLAAERTQGLDPERQPFVLQRALGDFAVTYELNVYCNDPSRILALYTELHRQILDVFNEYGIQIMTPAYEGDPEQPKLVPREQWFTAPAAPEPSRRD